MIAEQIEFTEPVLVEGGKEVVAKASEEGVVSPLRRELSFIKSELVKLADEVAKLKSGKQSVKARGKELLDLDYILKCKNFKERMDYMGSAITFGGIEAIKLGSGFKLDKSVSRVVRLGGEVMNEVQLFRHMFMDTEFRLLRTGIDLIIEGTFSNYTMLCNLLKELGKTGFSGVINSVELDRILIDPGTLEVLISVLHMGGELRKLTIRGLDGIITKMLYERLSYGELELCNTEYGGIDSKLIISLITYYKERGLSLGNCAITGVAIVVKEGSEADYIISSTPFKACKVSREY